MNRDGVESNLPKNHPVTIAAELLARIEQVNEQMPFITTLRHPGVRTRHWKEIQEVLGYDIRPLLDLSVKDVISMDFDGQKYLVDEILSKAMNEYNVEFGRDKMVEDLNALQFVVESCLLDAD